LNEDAVAFQINLAIMNGINEFKSKMAKRAERKARQSI